MKLNLLIKASSTVFQISSDRHALWHVGAGKFRDDRRIRRELYGGKTEYARGNLADDFLIPLPFLSIPSICFPSLSFPIQRNWFSFGRKFQKIMNGSDDENLRIILVELLICALLCSDDNDPISFILVISQLFSNNFLIV